MALKGNRLFSLIISSTRIYLRRNGEFPSQVMIDAVTALEINFKAVCPYVMHTEELREKLI